MYNFLEDGPEGSKNGDHCTCISMRTFLEAVATMVPCWLIAMQAKSLW